MMCAMSEERREQVQEEARSVLSPVRVAVLLLLGALFLVVGGSRADAAEAEPVAQEAPKLVSTTLGALDAGPALTGLGATVDGVVDPVLTATEPVLEPVVEPVVEPVAAPLQPVVERVVPPLAGPKVTDLLAPVVAPAAAPERAVPSVPAAPASDAEPTVEAVTATATTTPAAASSADARTEPAAPAHGTPVSRSATSTTDGGTGTPVPYAVLLTAFAAVLLFAGGIAPRRVVAPLAPTFLPPVFPG
jgi:hypothetical protein